MGGTVSLLSDLPGVLLERAVHSPPHCLSLTAPVECGWVIWGSGCLGECLWQATLFGNRRAWFDLTCLMGL